MKERRIGSDRNGLYVGLIPVYNLKTPQKWRCSKPIDGNTNRGKK
jgi:hypothetical protein